MIAAILHLFEKLSRHCVIVIQASSDQAGSARRNVVRYGVGDSISREHLINDDRLKCANLTTYGGELVHEPSRWGTTKH